MRLKSINQGNNGAALKIYIFLITSVKERLLNMQPHCPSAIKIILTQFWPYKILGNPPLIRPFWKNILEPESANYGLPPVFVKFYWNTATVILFTYYLWLHFFYAVIGLSYCNRDHRAHKAYSLYYLVKIKKCVGSYTRRLP